MREECMKVKMRVREKSIEKYLVRKVAEEGGDIRKVKWINHNGAPDRIVFLPGHLAFWVELKSPGKKLEPHQEREHRRMRRFGEKIFVIDSFEKVDELFL
jgi:hypothetical protein